MRSRPTAGISLWLRRTANQALAARDVLIPRGRRYAAHGGRGPGLLARARLYTIRLADLPEVVRTVPRDPRGASLRWRRGAWVIRPAYGWRSFWFMPPLHRTTTIAREDDEAAADWAMRVYANPS